MYRSSIQLFTQERVEAMGVRDLDNQQPALTGMGVSDPGMVSDGHVSFICRDSLVWVCDTQESNHNREIVREQVC